MAKLPLTSMATGALNDKWKSR